MKIYIKEGWSGTWQPLEGNAEEVRDWFPTRHIRVAPSAVIMDGAHIADGVRVARNAVVGAGAVIGRGAYVGAGAVIGAGAVVGDRVHLRARTRVGQGVAVTLRDDDKADGKALSLERREDFLRR